jgi:hypothetical protein
MSRLSGLPADAYLQRLGSAARVRLPDLGRQPESREQIAAESAKYLAGRSVPSDDASPEEIRRFFDLLYDAGNGFESGKNLVTGWSPDSRGFVVFLDHAPVGTGLKYYSILSSRMRPARSVLLLGGTSQESLVFTTLDAEKSEPKDGWLRAEIVVLVKTKGDDIYPVALHSYFDPGSDRWWLLYAFRQCSPRVVISPRMVF